jgi:Sulfotransferase domain
MSLDVIGAGFGRTGTLSVSVALGKLGFPCYHMTDILFDPVHRKGMDFWAEVADTPPGTQHDWSRVFGDFRAAVDYPGCAVWRELMAAYPDAKVLLTLHPKGAEAWYDSTIESIYNGTGLESSSAFGAKFNHMIDELVWNRLLGSTMDHRDAAIARYKAHIEEVQDSVPADKLLTFSADQGWDPLCAFLGVPVPAEPFPRVNNREVINQWLSRMARLRDMRLGKKPAG